MREHLREGDSFSFEGLSLETFRALSAQPEAGSVAAQFTFEEQRIDGFVRADAHLAAYLAHACFNAKAPPTDEGNPAPLTRLESVMAGRAITNLTRHLGEVYAGAGLGRMRSAMAGARMGDAGQFNPDDFMVVFRYQLGDPERGMHLTIATGTGLLAAMREDQSATKKAPESTEHKQMAVAVPVMAAIVIGVWTVSLAELAQVRVGDEIVLPDGDDAWIASGGVRLQAARVELIEGRWHAWPKGAARSAA